MCIELRHSLFKSYDVNCFGITRSSYLTCKAICSFSICGGGVRRIAIRMYDLRFTTRKGSPLNRIAS